MGWSFFHEFAPALFVSGTRAQGRPSAHSYWGLTLLHWVTVATGNMYINRRKWAHKGCEDCKLVNMDFYMQKSILHVCEASRTHTINLTQNINFLCLQEISTGAFKCKVKHHYLYMSNTAVKNRLRFKTRRPVKRLFSLLQVVSSCEGMNLHWSLAEEQKD